MKCVPQPWELFLSFSHRCSRGETQPAPTFSVLKLILGQISAVFTVLTQQNKSNQSLFPLGFHRSQLCVWVQLLAVYKILDFMDVLAASSTLISHLSPTQLFVCNNQGLTRSQPFHLYPLGSSASHPHPQLTQEVKQPTQVSNLPLLGLWGKASLVIAGEFCLWSTIKFESPQILSQATVASKI